MKTFIIITTITMALFTSCNTATQVFKKDLKEHFANAGDDIPVMTREMIAPLPMPLQKYLILCGYIGREIPMNAEWIWENSRIKMKPDGKWLKLKTYQYNSAKQAFRIALMKARIGGVIPFEGRDLYINGHGHMLGKIMKGITVLDACDAETAQSAAIVLLVEAIMLPGAIFQDYLKWEAVDEFTVKGIIDDHGVRAEGLFHFDENGYVTRFTTQDRNYDNGDGTYKKMPYSIYLGEYENINGINIPTLVSAVWHLEEGDYEYWVGKIKRINYNIRFNVV
jgi:hypothetical protein